MSMVTTSARLGPQPNKIASSAASRTPAAPSSCRAVIDQLGDLIDVQRPPHGQSLEFDRSNLLDQAELVISHLLMQHGFTGNAFDNGEIQVARIVG